MQQHEDAEELVKFMKSKDRNQNEATTRQWIIDQIIYKIFSWPERSITFEENVHPGYADYILKNLDGSHLLLIEAKREGIYFTTPKHPNNPLYSNIKVSTLKTNSDIAKAINQAYLYCVGNGIEFAAITNGHEWIFFKAISIRKPWEQLNAFVIHDPQYFVDNFTEAYNIFDYNQLVKNYSLKKLLEPQMIHSKQTYTINGMLHYPDAKVDMNVYAKYIQTPIEYYFNDFNEVEDKEFLESCYVEDRIDNTKSAIQTLLNDIASPYFEKIGVIHHERKDLSKKLSKKIENFLEYGRQGDHLVVLYGDRGSGKSTFLKKLLHVDISQQVSSKLSIAYLDLLVFAANKDDQNPLKQLIWKQVIKAIDVDNLIDDYDAIQNVLFPDYFVKIKKQLQSVCGNNEHLYSEKLLQKIEEKLADFPELAQSLAKHLRESRKQEIVLVIDNTDQYDSETQDYSFQIAKEVNNCLQCLTIISIREERYFKSKNLGVMDAYHYLKYHIPSPRADLVFIKRLEYLISSLDNPNFYNSLLEHQNPDLFEKDGVSLENLKKYFLVFHNDFKNQLKLYDLLVSCAQNDMRKALDMFRSFIVSDYLGVEEMIGTKYNIFTLQTHQVLKPIMSPDKFFYHESSSQIPNLYNLRYKAYGSHFMSIRILKMLQSYGKEYVSITLIKSYFLSKFPDLEKEISESLNVMFESRLIESDIKVDTYVPEIDEIRITAFGIYVLDELIPAFTYIDLVCTDCTVYSEEIANSIAMHANQEYNYFKSRKRSYRMMSRIEKTNSFIKYLIEQEEKEKLLYNLKEEDINLLIMDGIKAKYVLDVKKVLTSAMKQTELEEFALKTLSDIEAGTML